MTSFTKGFNGEISNENEENQVMCICGVIKCRQSELGVKKHFHLFLYHLKERELLITKIYFLALANAIFRSKNTKNSKGVVSREKHTVFEMWETGPYSKIPELWNFGIRPLLLNTRVLRDRLFRVPNVPSRKILNSPGGLY
jgi:hypothetical protein